MNEQDLNNEEIFDAIADEIPEGDRPRFDSESERTQVKIGDKTEKADAKSPPTIKLENELKNERLRREAAEAKLVGVQAKFDEIKKQMERETQEMRARMQKTLEDRAKQGQFNFLTALLPVLDNLNLAINASEQNASSENLIDGVRGTARLFEQALMNVGVEAVPAVGTEFNPELHEAVDMRETNPDEDGKITAEYTRGYKFGDRLLRPAKVQVGKAVQAQSKGE